MFEKQIGDWQVDKDLTEELERKARAERIRLEQQGVTKQM